MAKNRAGQVVVELLLILPVFFLMIFFIMEIGNLAYQTILANHAGYELARIGSLIAGPSAKGGDAGIGAAKNKMDVVLKKLFPNATGMQLNAILDPTLEDPQVSGHQNEDVIVTFVYPAKLVFPVSSYLLSSPRGSGKRNITVRIRMPVEKPLRS